MKKPSRARFILFEIASFSAYLERVGGVPEGFHGEHEKNPARRGFLVEALASAEVAGLPLRLLAVAVGLEDFLLDLSFHPREPLLFRFAVFFRSDEQRSQEGVTAETHVVQTSNELQKVLDSPHSGMVFVESVMDKYDAPIDLIVGGHALADSHYGVPGPQSAANAQIPFPTHAATSS